MCKLSLPAPILSPFSVLAHFCSPNSNKAPPRSETIRTPSGPRAQYQLQVHVAAATAGPTLITQSRKLSSVCWDTGPAAGANLLQPGVPICSEVPQDAAPKPRLGRENLQVLFNLRSSFYRRALRLSACYFAFLDPVSSSGIETIIITAI